MPTQHLAIHDTCHLYLWEDSTTKTGKNGTVSTTRLIKNPIRYSSYFYETFFFDKYRPKIGDVILDAGAGIGESLGYLSSLVGDSGQIIAVEADPELCEYSELLVSKLQLTNVTVINAALHSSSNSEIKLYRNENWEENTTVPGKFDECSVLVKTISIDDIFKNLNLDKIDFVKMNIEGSEVNALRGSQQNFYRINNWCVSAHDFIGIETKRDVIDFFKENNRKVEYYSVPGFHPALDDYVFSNKED
jgi:FkbM family methyltransferase